MRKIDRADNQLIIIYLSISFKLMNKYEIMDMIDEGAYGIVWKAINKDSGNLGKFPTIKLPSKNSRRGTMIKLLAKAYKGR